MRSNAGRVYDGAMGNYFYRARYYNQSLGRFFSRDPIFSLTSLYAYCGNSPVNFTDPTGCRQYIYWWPLFCASGARIYYWPGTGEYYVRESDGTERCIQEGDEDLHLYSEEDGDTGYTWKQVKQSGGKAMGCPYGGGFDPDSMLFSSGDEVFQSFMLELGDGQFNPGQFGGASGYSGIGESRYFSDPGGPTDPSVGQNIGLEPPGAGGKRMTFLIPKGPFEGGPLSVSAPVNRLI